MGPAGPESQAEPEWRAGLVSQRATWVLWSPPAARLERRRSHWESDRSPASDSHWAEARSRRLQTARRWAPGTEWQPKPPYRPVPPEVPASGFQRNRWPSLRLPRRQLRGQQDRPGGPGGAQIPRSMTLVGDGIGLSGGMDPASKSTRTMSGGTVIAKVPSRRPSEPPRRPKEPSSRSPAAWLGRT